LRAILQYRMGAAGVVDTFRMAVSRHKIQFVLSLATLTN
jgi:hypothetical protein